MPKTKRSRKKKSYLQCLREEPLKVGKWPGKDDRSHAVSYKKPFYLAGFASLIGLASVSIIVFGAYSFYNNQTLAGIKVLILCIFAYLAVYFVTFLLRKNCRCPLCRGYTLVDGKNQKHIKAFRIRPLSFGVTAGITILLAGRFRCQHCGTPYSLSKKHHR